MLPVLEEPAIRERVQPISVEAFHQLFAAGALKENVELIRGALVEKMPKSPLHAGIVTRLATRLAVLIPVGFHVRSEQPLTFFDSEPEPDVAVVRGSDMDFDFVHPTSAELVAEVVVTSERIDRVKLGIYAEAGIPECWLILAEEKVIERHTRPVGAVYQEVERAAFPATLPSTVFLGVNLPPPAVLSA